MEPESIEASVGHVRAEVEQCVALLQDRLDEAGVQEEQCLELSSIMMRHPEICVSALVVEAGGVVAVAAALQVHAGSREVQRTGCIALFRLAAGGTACAQAVVEAGGLAATVAAMRSDPGNVEIQWNGCSALWRVAEGGALCTKAVVETGGVSATVAAMRSHSSSEEVQWNGCSALLGLAASGTACAQAVVEAGGVPVTVAAMRSHSSSEDVQQNGCGALSLSCGRRHVMCSGGGGCGRWAGDRGRDAVTQHQ